MKIDLTCPVELWQYAMPTEDDSECTFMLNNLSDKVVTSVQVTLACFDKEDQLLFHQTERMQGLKAGVGERFSIMLLPMQWRDVQSVDLVIEKVWFDDATIWRRGNAQLIGYTSNALPSGRMLDELRFVAGPDAVGYPQAQDQVWMCVCGRANRIDSQRCCRCERRRDAVFASFSVENVQQVIAVHEQKLLETARKAREDNSILVETQEKKRVAKKRRSKQMVKLVLSVAIAAVVVVSAVIWGIPALRYNAACGLKNAGNFEGARAAFREMGNAYDSPEQIKQCDYEEAMASLKLGDEAGLTAAAAGFEALGDYEDSHMQWQQAVYALGEKYLSANQYELAAGMYQSLGDYNDSADKLRESTYRQADALLTADNAAVARVLFAGLENYKDSADKILRCDYIEAKALFESNVYEQAIEKLSVLGPYEDAPDLLKQASYQLAEQKLAAEEFEEAGKYYLLALDYQDAAAKANDCLYQLAQQNKSAGDYEKAATLFMQISGYLDSDGQAQACIYEQAMVKKKTGDDAGAAALLETIPRHKDAKQQLYECNYRLAMAAIEQGDAAQAEQLLENVDNYEDSEKQLRAVRYQLAEEALAKGDYEFALTRYSALGTYKGSDEKAKQCRYELEKTVPQNGQAAKELNDIAMAEAKKLEDAGDYEGASAKYLALGDFAEAKERYNACRYAIALKLQKAGDLRGAGAAFLQIKDYQDAAALSEACYAELFDAKAKPAREAMKAEDYAAVITTLEGFDTADLPQGYKDLSEMYNEACYRYADQLYRDDKPYEALPYYQRIMAYKDVADQKLTKKAYLILGTWQSTTGKTAVFNADGTCDLMGEKLFFRVSNFSLYTGAEQNTMTITHKLSNIQKMYMSLRDIRNGQDVVYKFDRVGTAELPAFTPAPLVTQAPPAKDNPLEDMLVTEDDDEPNP
ncbi:MAG: hypothetical protein RSE58_11675 [Clostridia bacterium]